MSDTPTVQGVVTGLSAGEQLRTAREATGLHIVALAAALKVPVRKLEALEANRWEELTDATFVRALAGSVARHLKMDPAPVLQALPAGKAVPIEVPDNLGTASDGGQSFGLTEGIPKIVWVVLALLVAALALYLVPDAALKPITGQATTRPVVAGDGNAKAPTEPTVADKALPGQVVVEQPVAVPAAASAVSPPAVAAADNAGAAGTSVTTSLPAASSSAATSVQTANTVLTIQATADTWIEVVGGDGKLRAQRLLKQGESADFNDSPVFAVVLGNASGAKVWVKGKPFDLVPATKNNIARFEAN